MQRILRVTLAAVASNQLFARADSEGKSEGKHVNSEQSVALPIGAPLDKPLTIHLQRVKARGGSAATFYTGKLALGQPPQELNVLFDTSSGHVLVPHSACKSLACREHVRYSPWKSSTAMDVNVDGSAVEEGRRLARNGRIRTGISVDFTQADLGEGTAKSVVVRDNVCLEGDQGDACVDLEVVAAVDMQDIPFRAMPNDGIVGLGLESLAAGPLLSFMSRLMEGSKNVLPQFGISFGAEGGDVYFGGQKPSLTSAIQWLPVDHPEGGYWQVEIKSVRVGGKTVDSCRRGCHGIIDSGTSHLGVQSYRLPMLRPTLTTQLVPSVGCTGPTLEFDMGDTVISLEAPDYSDEACKPAVGPLNLEEPAFVGVYAFGESVLRRYYVAFDWASKRVGFAPSSTSSPAAVVV